MNKIVWLLFILFAGCSSSQHSIFVEKVPKNLLDDENRFDLDNKIYPIGKELVFKFTISKNYSLLNSEIDLINLEILGTTKPFNKLDPDYSQTVIKYTYFDKNGKLLLTEKTGLIENDRNIWFHPPRSNDAGILQLSAFPYIKFNDKRKWKWNLEAAYSNYGSEVYKHKYTQNNSVLYESNLGRLLCDVILAETESSNGYTTSRFLYNNQYGFVLLEFSNLDGTKITLTLIK